MKIKKLTAALCAALAMTTLAGCQASFKFTDSSESSSAVVIPRSVAVVTTLYQLHLRDGASSIDWREIGGVPDIQGPATVILPKTLKAEKLMFGLRKQGELTFIDSTITFAEFGQAVPIGQGATGYLSKKICEPSKHEAEPSFPMATVATLPGADQQTWVTFDSNFALRDSMARMNSCWTVDEARQAEDHPYVKHLLVIKGGEGIATAWPAITPSGQPAGKTLTLMVLRPLLME
jgi:hypothetical protein